MTKKTNYEKIYNIAFELREEIVKKLHEQKSIFPSNLECACATASYFLYRRLKRAGYKPSFICGLYDYSSGKRAKLAEHCWVEINNLIVDITSTQFGNKHKVSILKSNNKKYKKEFMGPMAVHVVNTDWPYDQRPTTYEGDIET